MWSKQILIAAHHNFTFLTWIEKFGEKQDEVRLDTCEPQRYVIVPYFLQFLNSNLSIRSVFLLNSHIYQVFLSILHRKVILDSNPLSRTDIQLVTCWNGYFNLLPFLSATFSDKRCLNFDWLWKACNITERCPCSRWRVNLMKFFKSPDAVPICLNS